MKSVLFLILLIPLLCHSAKLSWDDPENSRDVIAGYRIYWKLSTEEGCPNEAKAVHSVEVGRALTYDLGTDENFTPGKTYEFQVTAYNSFGESAPSNETVCYTFPNEVNPVDLDPYQLAAEEIQEEEVSEDESQNPIIKTVHKTITKTKERRSEKIISIGGFTNFSKPNGPSSESNIYVGARPSEWSGRVHTVHYRAKARWAASGSGESGGIRQGPDSLDNGGDQHPQVDDREPRMDGDEEIHVPVNSVQGYQRPEVRVHQVRGNHTHYSSGKPPQTNEPSTTLGWVLLVIAIVVVGLWIAYRKR